MGIAILRKERRFLGVHVFLALVVISSMLNVVEATDLRATFGLITPIFVIGFAPAYYIAATYLIQGQQPWHTWLHFLPMFVALPFAHHVQEVIAVGTLARVGYTIITVYVIIKATRQLAEWRSDVADVSLVWFAWLVATSTVVSGLDLIRLNFQVELGRPLNMTLYVVAAAIGTVLLAAMIVLLNKQSAEQAMVDSSPKMPPAPSQDTEGDFQAIFAEVDKQVVHHEWYCQPRLTLADVSTMTGCQVRDISRAINLVSKMSFNDYINKHRINKVKRMLNEHSSKPVLEIGIDAGFSSKAAFNAAFKKFVGLTPTQFKRQSGTES